jgi:hypothetical protein
MGVLELRSGLEVEHWAENFDTVHLRAIFTMARFYYFEASLHYFYT